MRLLLISSSVVHGHGFLEHSDADIRRLLDGRRSVAFVPFAKHDHDEYTAKVKPRFDGMGVRVVQVRERGDIQSAEAIFVGGGNTFRLLDRMYAHGLLDVIRARVKDGIPYIGSSAGTNVAGPTIKTTNDMPIVHPPSFDALGLVPFQINPHYLDPDPGSTHKGETREERIREFLEDNATPVVGLREGSALWVEDARVTLLGDGTARVFRRGQEPEEVAWRTASLREAE